MRQKFGRPLFATGVMALGILDLVYRDTIMWKVLPPNAPVRAGLAVLAGLLLLVTGAGLFSTRFRGTAARILLMVLLIWDLLIGIPPVVSSPKMEVFWLIFGMMTIVAVAAGILAGQAVPLRMARIIVGLALIPVGLSHFFYLKTTLDLVPGWMPARLFIVYLVGVAHIAAGLGVLFGLVPRLAALLEAGMLISFSGLVWVPRVITSPGVHFNWTELLGTWVIGAAMWVVADTYPGDHR